MLRQRVRAVQSAAVVALSLAMATLMPCGLGTVRAQTPPVPKPQQASQAPKASAAQSGTRCRTGADQVEIYRLEKEIDELKERRKALAVENSRHHQRLDQAQEQDKEEHWPTGMSSAATKAAYQAWADSLDRLGATDKAISADQQKLAALRALPICVPGKAVDRPSPTPTPQAQPPRTTPTPQLSPPAVERQATPTPRTAPTPLVECPEQTDRLLELLDTLDDEQDDLANLSEYLQDLQKQITEIALKNGKDQRVGTLKKEIEDAHKAYEELTKQYDENLSEYNRLCPSRLRSPERLAPGLRPQQSETILPPQNNPAPATPKGGVPGRAGEPSRTPKGRASSPLEGLLQPPKEPEVEPPPLPPTEKVIPSPDEQVKPKPSLASGPTRVLKPISLAEQAVERERATPIDFGLAAVAVVNAQPGADVAKRDVLLVDTSTQQAIPGGTAIIVPDDPKQPIPPPIPVKADGKATLPPLQPKDRVVVLPKGHQKIELTGDNLPIETGVRIPVSEQLLRLVVHDTPCTGVTDRLIEQGLADQYGARTEATGAAGLQKTELRYGTADFLRTDCLVAVPLYVPLRAERGIVPKDGPTRTQDGKVIEADQPREIQNR